MLCRRYVNNCENDKVFTTQYIELNKQLKKAKYKHTQIKDNGHRNKQNITLKQMELKSMEQREEYKYLGE